MKNYNKLRDQPKWLEQFSENCSNGAKDSQNEGQGERSRNIHQSYGPDWCGGNNERKKIQHIRPRRVIKCNCEDGHLRLMNSYFSEISIYTKTQFRHSDHNEYFQMRYDVVGRMSLSPLQKCIAPIRILAYRSPADYVYEYVRIGECTTTQCLQKFVKGVKKVFGQ
ncbi:hypothetical protein GmHk_20G058116 [Glycine max]|nr:hypothetical protein GmHk_20G058116 [Glycine max]